MAQVKQKLISEKGRARVNELKLSMMEDEIADYESQATQTLEDVNQLKTLQQESLEQLETKMTALKIETELKHKKRLLQLEGLSEAAILRALRKAREQAQHNIEAATREIKELRLQIEGLPAELQAGIAELRSTHQDRLEELRSNMDSMRNDLAAEAETVQQSTTALENEILVVQNTILSEKSAQLEKTSGVLLLIEEGKSEEQRQLLILKEANVQLHGKILNTRRSIANKNAEISTYNLDTENLVKEFPAMEERRRALHETFQELKGNIRVFCRVRPALEGSECADISVPSADIVNLNGKQDLLVRKEASHGKVVHSFEFDKIFDRAALNTDIFPELAQLVQSAIDGLNICIFAYGQTCSGKTWTMSHPEDGMIALSIHKIFEDIANLEAQGWTHRVEGQFLEIYNESIIDLLSTPNSSPKKLEIKHDDDLKKTSVPGLRTVKLTSEKQAIEVLQKASIRRSTASTKANDRSSRSHSVFVIKIIGENKQSGKRADGILNLVDLAGSERLASSQARGDRLKETQAINKSLSSLGDVIHSLKGKQALVSTHVPFRNSKLTYLLKHSLSGNSKTLMFVNISAHSKDLNETVNSLRFASKVNSTRVE